ncbi:hypothetical protein EVAR_96437_1 [Eumeta japonica]|uniref:Uncharacterized protein n=1 Tax=Eumeta variegata TaxID=151549 RepID=A0A4C1VWI6_EUMVA|nr:hypothetical protein EVAR_96437_1 [Eumeta japonica]
MNRVDRSLCLEEYVQPSASDVVVELVTKMLSSNRDENIAIELRLNKKEIRREGGKGRKKEGVNSPPRHTPKDKPTPAAPSAAPGPGSCSGSHAHHHGRERDVVHAEVTLTPAGGWYRAKISLPLLNNFTEVCSFLELITYFLTQNSSISATISRLLSSTLIMIDSVTPPIDLDQCQLRYRP